MITKQLKISAAVLIGLGTMSFAWMNWNDDNTNCQSVSEEVQSPKKGQQEKTDLAFGEHEFHLSMHSRFREMKRSSVLKANSIVDLVSLPELKEATKLKSLLIEPVVNDEPTGKYLMSNSLTFSPKQKEMLRTAEMSSSFKVQIDYEKKDPFSDKVMDEYTSPYFTIVPETMAEYEFGTEALVDYMRNASNSETMLLKDKRVSPAKFVFTVSKTGTLKNIELNRSCGFPFVDDMLMGLIKQAPGKWIPAKDINGAPVEQEFYFFFGEMGC